MFIPGFIIGWATFPGVIVHEWAHKIVCERRGIAVSDVSYFNLSGGGYVEHADVRSFGDQLAISIAPLLFNTALSAVLWVAVQIMASGGMESLDRTEAYLLLGGAWLAVSVGWHAIPSTTDASHIYAQSKRKWLYSDRAALAVPLVVLLYVANLLEFLWFDAVYAIAIALAVGALLQPVGFDPIWVGSII